MCCMYCTLYYYNDVVISLWQVWFKAAALKSIQTQYLMDQSETAKWKDDKL